MPYSEANKAKEAQQRYRDRKKGITEASVIPTENVIPNVIPVDPSDWRDRRNYSEAYLACLDEQGGTITEASRVAMRKNWEWKSESPKPLPGIVVNICGEKLLVRTPDIRRKLLAIYGELEKSSYATPGGKRGCGLDAVRFGVSGPTFRELGKEL